jgi:hypothetical protein
MTAAVVWSLKAGRSAGVAAYVIGTATFGGMFLIGAIAAGVFMARRPHQIAEELLREPVSTGRSCWKMALLAEAQRYIATTDLKPQRPASADSWHERRRTRNELAMCTNE